MRVSKTDHLPGIPGKFECYTVENCRIRHDAVPATDELGAYEGTEWFFKEARDRDTGMFDAYAWVWLRKASGEVQLTEIVLSEVYGLDRANPIFDKRLFSLVRWAREEVEARLRDDPELYGIEAVAIAA
ncbi:hypothetical protein [Mesorhizobium sp. B2-4-6]|uniref:hypothetical protein n=1 Tax=Mesorhizobium sp. B2-4-6 TaxID=2589943 RepID=UPI00112AFD68|nr:hypothetical protein [Mesorhizobium sp. B2-4-6]TPL45339.1 hypothetical protein FJ957_20735 [Mesorhizobium sp. B2-4-6]